MDRETLPIEEVREQLVRAARECPRFLVVAPTGSGKSTRVPQMLLDAELARGRIVVLQPRRLAARLLAARVAWERGGELGGEVGYQVRFESAWGPRTRILFVTEGVLLRQLADDPQLRDVDVVILDEFHERHLYADVALAVLLRLQRTARPDLRLGLMSATLPTEALEQHLAPCRTVRAEGRLHPVEIRHLPAPLPSGIPVWEAAAQAMERLAAEGVQGHVLIFMPGLWEIHRTLDVLRGRPALRGWRLLPLHGELPVEAQNEAVNPGGRPSVIVSTNIAETSLTIPGVRAVIDSGLARVPRHDPHRGLNTLRIEPISRASADQRAGRAGRTGPGICIRLWTEREHRHRPAHEIPEIRRLELSEVVLLLRTIGLADLSALPWLEPPPPEALARADRLLRDLGALAADGSPTPLGRQMAQFALHPRYARMLIEADRRRCVRTVALLASFTQGRPLLSRRQFRDLAERADLPPSVESSDFFVVAEAWRSARESGFDAAFCERLGLDPAAARQVERLQRSFLEAAERAGCSTREDAPADAEIRKCLLAGFADHVARRLDGGTLRCALTEGRRGRLDAGSVVRGSPLLVAAEIHEIERRDTEVVLSWVTAIDEAWLEELSPGAVETGLAAGFDRAQQRVVTWRRRVFRGLVLDERPGAPPTPEVAARVLADELEASQLRLPLWDERAESWIARVNFVARRAPELGIPPIGAEERRLVLEQLCFGCVSLREVRERPVLPVLEAVLSPEQRHAVEQMAPERIPLPSGRRARIHYPNVGEPFIAETIQDLYGLTEVPRILGGRYPLVVQILAPNRRPVQITRDLPAFWRDVYPVLRAHLARKYPRHEWR